MKKNEETSGRFEISGGNGGKQSHLDVLLQPLSCCHAQEEVKSWKLIFVKKPFVFVGSCLARKRYRNRQLMAAELLTAPLTVYVNWLVHAFSGSYAALISKRCCLFRLPVDLAGVAGDRTLIPNIDLIANSQVNTKEFFTKTNFWRAVLPAAVGKAVARKILGKAPKVAIAMPRVGARVQFRAMLSEGSFNSGFWIMRLDSRKRGRFKNLK
jgi:hypothetical protein